MKPPAFQNWPYLALLTQALQEGQMA